MDKIEEILTDFSKKHNQWDQFRKITETNIQTVEANQQIAENKRKELDTTIATIKTLSTNARASAFLNLTPLCYIKGTVKHTGEFTVHYNTDYKAILTKDQTIDYLERKKRDVLFDLDMYESQLIQLQKRMNINDDDIPPGNVEGMPEKIVSDKGVAINQGGFYEILEHEDVPVSKESKRISRVKS